MTIDIEIKAAVLADENTLLLFGTAARPLPPDSPAMLEEVRVPATGTAHSWPRGPEGHWFVACIQAPDLARHRPGRILLSPPGQPPIALPRLSNVRIDPTLLLTALSEHAASALPSVFDFLRTAVPAPAPRLARVLAAMLTAVSRPAGFSEIFGRFGAGEGGLMVQGWSRNLPAGACDLLLEGGGILTEPALVGQFDRADLPADAVGLVAVLPACTAEPDTLRRLHYRTEQGWFHLESLNGRTLLADGMAGPHLRDMLGRLRCDPATARSLRRIAHSRFEGVETVSRLGQPIRIALDRALVIPGRGLFIQGWMLDPEDLAGEVHLRGPGLSRRLDTIWARTARPDVTDAFTRDPAFAGRLFPGFDDHGFLAWVPGPVEATQGWHLALELTTRGRGEEMAAFLPVPVGRPTADMARQLLGSFDIGDPAVTDLIAAHIGPLMEAIGSRTPDLPVPAHRLNRRENGDGGTTLMLAVADGREDLDLHLARIATDPDLADLNIVIAAGGNAHRNLAGRLKQAARFYRLSVTIVPVPWAQHAVQAMAAALRHVRTARVLLMSAGVLPLEPGWLAVMAAALDGAGSGTLVNPTLLYEDYSIRFAGYGREPGADRPGGLVPLHAGYPRAWLPAGGVRQSDAATLDCALLPSALARTILTGTEGFVEAEAAALDASMRLARAGGTCLWTADVRLVALDEGGRDIPYWQRTAALVDRWIFDHRWGTGQPARAGAANDTVANAA